MSHIAIIPARSGSKGLVDKNVKELCGKPLMAYSIEAAIKSKCFDTVHVSTDSREYANIAMQYGGDVPFLRRKETSTDSASSWDVVKEVLDRYKERGREFTTVTLLQPTSPLRTYQDIQDAMAYFKEKNANAVISVCEMEHSPLWCNILPDDLSMDGFGQSGSCLPRQMLDVYYRVNGAIYIVKCGFLYENAYLYREGCYAYKMEKDRSIDIDTQFDFDLADFLMGKTEK